LAASQESAVQLLPSSQLSAWPTHLPPLHTSWVVQAVVSLQSAALATAWQPLALSQ
jgi:hypothetical protein